MSVTHELIERTRAAASPRAALLVQQRSWAQATALDTDSKGYLAKWLDNLYQPLSARAEQAFKRGGGSELLGRRGGRAKMSALPSSAALAVNVFDYWSERACGPLITALALEGSTGPIEFEAQFPTGLDGTRPNLDVAIRFDSGVVTGIESKFTEWLAPKSPNKDHFKDKYFEVGETADGRWTSASLPDCQDLFADAVGSETGFRWGTYQELFARLDRDAALQHPRYVEYLRDRYFPDRVVANQQEGSRAGG